ncbi:MULTISPECIES: DUF7002 family protein [unclassified Kribbella]|uniref:DUF7002 family protein n=1 Tax=unclassified Kribbella TaxID=2644121 RepID=UPI003076BAD4
MDPELLARLHPCVFHSTSESAWPSIQKFGLQSTLQLLDIFGVTEAQRTELLSRPRRESVVLHADGLPAVVIRDQKPMKFIGEKIDPESSLQQYLDAINSRVFFWASRERLERLRDAKEYRGQPQVILCVDTGRLIERYERAIQLCRFNSGAIMQKNHPTRGHRSWLSIADYPYEEYERRYGRGKALAEVTVLDAVPDIEDLLIDVEFVR